MEEVKIEETKTVVKFKTSDGQVYDRRDRAELHERALELAKKVGELKYIDGAYYCKTQEDFDAVVDCYAYHSPSYDSNANQYKPGYHYSKSDFYGEDWYFFYHENDDYADEYWVESLSEKKADWDAFYNQFVMEETDHEENGDYVDEFPLLLNNSSTADYLKSIWKRARKFQGVSTEITQNMEE